MFFKTDSRRNCSFRKQIAWNYELGGTLREKKHFDKFEYINEEEFNMFVVI